MRKFLFLVWFLFIFIPLNSSSCGLRKIFLLFLKTGFHSPHRRRGSWRPTTRQRMTFKPSVDPIPENYAFDDGSDSDSDSDLDSVSISESPTVQFEDERKKLD